jgi:hypothetical protein
MKIKEGILFTVFSLIALSPGTAWAIEDSEYGRYLFKQGKDQSAVFELERSLFFHPNAPDARSLRLLLGLAYARTGQYSTALFVLGGLVQELEQGGAGSEHQEREQEGAGGEYRGLEQEGSGAERQTLLCESAFHILNIHFRQGDTHDFFPQRERFSHLCQEPNQELEHSVQRMAVSLRINGFDWEGALRELDAASTEFSASLREEIQPLVGYRGKSPVIGGILSIVPGLGHVYAGRPGDGLRSLLINCSFFSLSYFSFKEQMPVLGAVFGLIELFLYSSNIYGGVNAVLQENARFLLSRRDDLLKRIPAPPLDVITLRKELDL